jgi:dTDP-glucose 4,6-dehydratase
MAKTFRKFFGNNMIRRILVTGGAGFIGSNFVRLILAEQPDCFIANLDNLTYAGNLENLEGFLNHKNHAFVKGDICDGKTIEETIDKYKINIIINFAAESHVDRSITGPKIFIETNVTGTLTLLQAACDKKIEKFVQISTDEVYGSLVAEGKFTEQSPLSPNSPYSASKTAADHLVCAFGHTFGLNYNITRCSNNYGPYQFPEKMIPLMINNALAEEPLPVYGDGGNVRDWIHVEDHCRAIWKVLTDGKDGEIYNIGSSNEKTNLEVVKTILKFVGKPESLITFVKDRPGHDRRYAIDSAKINSQLGWQAQIKFEPGIKNTIDWYLKNKKWLADVTSGQYQKYYQQMYANR